MTTNPPETVIVDSYKIACDGGKDGGHPRVWLQMPEDSQM